MAEELKNPLFDEEREFLERKKQEYERALRGDVDHIKEQSVQVGKVAAVGAGLAGTIWLISKAFGGGKKRKAKKQQQDRLRAAEAGSRSRDAYYDDADDEFELDDEAFALDRSAEFRDQDGRSLSDVARLDTMVTVVDAVNLTRDFSSHDFIAERGESLGEEDERRLVDLLTTRSSSPTSSC